LIKPSKNSDTKVKADKRIGEEEELEDDCGDVVENR